MVAQQTTPLPKPSARPVSVDPSVDPNSAPSPAPSSVTQSTPLAQPSAPPQSTTPPQPSVPTPQVAGPVVPARPTALSDQQRKLLQQQAATPAAPDEQPIARAKSRFTSVAPNTLPDEATQAPPQPEAPQPSNVLPSGARTESPGTSEPLVQPTPQKQSPPPKSPPKFASLGSAPWVRPLVFGLFGLIVLLLLIWAVGTLTGRGSDSGTTAPANSGGTTTSQNGSQSGSASGNQVTLTYWGLWEPESVMQPVFDEYEAANPGVKINYIKQSHQNYRERLMAAISSGNGPDIFRFHGSWTPMLSEELAPVPSSVISGADFRTQYYPVVAEQLQINGQPIGIPLMYDGLVLFTNDEALQTANAQPPSTWAELKTLASRLTIRSGGTITRAGLAIGNATNVEHFADIVAVLMLQNGADLSNPNSPEGRDALLFYTNFMQGSGAVWSESLPNSTAAFARGEVAMMFAPSWRAHEIAALNPDLTFSTSPMPQLSDEVIGWASYWAEGVSAESDVQSAAWQLVQYLSQEETLKTLHANQAELRDFGEIYPNVSMANDLANNTVVAAVLEDAPFAQGWYMSTSTHDNGLNDQINQYYQEAIQSVLSGTSVEDALITLSKGVAQVLRQFGAN